MKQYRTIYGRLLVVILAVLWADKGLAQVASDSLWADTVVADTARLMVRSSAVNKALAIDEAVPLDTSVVDSLLKTVKKRRNMHNFRPDPIRAMWLALVLPGGGQVYNRKFWKLPIVYGGFLGCAYALTWNNQMLRDYSQAYIDIMDNDPNTKSYEAMLPIGYSIEGKEERFKTIFKNKKDHYRKYRDMSILAFVGYSNIITFL